MWGHEHWFLQDKPDIVTFGGKAGISGYYTNLDYKLSYDEFPLEQNVDLIKVLNYGIIWKTILNKDLLSYVQDTSTFLKIELGRIEKEKGSIRNVRGYGTFLGFDTPSPYIAENMQKYFFKSGINLLRCGENTFGLRPALILGPKHAANLRENLLYFHPGFAQ